MKKPGKGMSPAVKGMSPPKAGKKKKARTPSAGPPSAQDMKKGDMK